MVSTSKAMRENLASVEVMTEERPILILKMYSLKEKKLKAKLHSPSCCTVSVVMGKGPVYSGCSQTNFSSAMVVPSESTACCQFRHYRVLPRICNGTFVFTPQNANAG